MADRPETTKPAKKAIRAVSAALKAGKTALAKPPKPATLPRFPAPRKPPGQPAGSRAEAISPSINPPSVPLPDRAATGPKGSTGDAAPLSPDKAPTKQTPTAAGATSIPAVSRTVPPVSAVSKAIGSPAAPAPEGPRSQKTETHRLDVTVGSIASQAAPEPSQESPTRPNSPSMAEVAPKAEAARAGAVPSPGPSPSVKPLVAPGRTDLVASGTNPSTLNHGSISPDSRPAPASIGATLGVGRATMPGSSSSRPTSSPTVSVPGTFSTGLRNLSGAGQASSGAGGLSPDLGGFARAPAESGFGSMSSSSQESGGAMDLSKTNELLQQLVDAVRRQRDASMPVGGPPAYSGR